MRYVDLLIAAGKDFLQWDNNFNPNVLSPDLPLASPVDKAVKQSASETAQIKSETTPENFIKVDTAEKIFLGKPGNTGKPPIIVLLTLFRVGKYGIRFCNLFKLLLGARFFVPVRMVF